VPCSAYAPRIATVIDQVLAVLKVGTIRLAPWPGRSWSSSLQRLVPWRQDLSAMDLLRRRRFRRSRAVPPNFAITGVRNLRCGGSNDPQAGVRPPGHARKRQARRDDTPTRRDRVRAGQI
jgi:hypothetical protein